MNSNFSTDSSDVTYEVRTAARLQRERGSSLMLQGQPVLAQVFLLIILMLLVTYFNVDTGAGEASLLIDFGDKQRMFTGEVLDGMTILDALNASVVAGQIPMEFTVDTDGAVRIILLDGRRDITDDGHLVVLLNDQEIRPSGINSVRVQSGDKIEIKLPPR